MTDLYSIAVAFGFATTNDPTPHPTRHDISRSIRSRAQRAIRTQREAASSKASISPSRRSRDTSPGRRIAPLGQTNDTELMSRIGRASPQIGLRLTQRSNDDLPL